MDSNEVEKTIADLVNDAAELAARAVGCGLARLIDFYVPPRLAGRFATRVAVVLLREVKSRQDSGLHVIRG